jgi:YtxH-like protein
MADNVGSKVTYFLVGLGVGALVGILFAPKSGEETRDFLAKKADEGKDYAQQGNCGQQEGFHFGGSGSRTRSVFAPVEVVRVRRNGRAGAVS